MAFTGALSAPYCFMIIKGGEECQLSGCLAGIEMIDMAFACYGRIRRKDDIRFLLTDHLCQGSQQIVPLIETAVGESSGMSHH